jgi:hypothetical protein
MSDPFDVLALAPSTDAPAAPATHLDALDRALLSEAHLRVELHNRTIAEYARLHNDAVRQRDERMASLSAMGAALREKYAFGESDPVDTETGAIKRRG